VTSYSLSEEQRAIQDLVRRVAREKVAQRADAIDRTAEYPQDMFDLLRGIGLFALPFPADYGGTGSVLSGCLAVEELGRVCYNTGYLLVVQWVAFGALFAAGNDEQKARFLPGLASGELRGAFSTTEAQSGSDVQGIKTRATRVPGGYTLKGSKIWCTNSNVADFVLVGAKCAGSDGRDSINLFIVEKGTAGFTVGGHEDKMGARGVPSCPLFFDDAFVPEANRMGPEGSQGFKSVMEAFNASRPIVAARAVGIAQGAIDHSLEFIRNRHAFGQTVSDFQGVRWMIADMATQTEAARHLTYKAAAAVDAGEKGPEMGKLAAMAKCFASDVAMKVATDAVQLFGAAGISNEFPINRYFRDAKVVQVIEGTNQIQRNIIANALLGREGKT
jgi:alkylation response protein AidB-like acyl-CoA dehydrogenase